MESRLWESSGFLPRLGDVDDIVWVDVPVGYAFHLNAFDNDDGSVTIDLCKYKSYLILTSGPFGGVYLALSVGM